MKSNEFPTGKYQIYLSVPKNADVAIGQGFYLNITITSNEAIPTDFKFTLDNYIGLNVESINPSLSAPSTPNSIDFLAYLVIDDSGSMAEGESTTVSYGVNISGVEPKKISYTARKINQDEIKLKVDKLICHTPEKDEMPKSMGDDFILYSMILTDGSGHLMKNTPMQIYSDNLANLNERIVITTDPSKGTPFRIIKPILSDKYNFIPISSNDEGNVSFRVYPVKNKPAVIQLGIQLAGANSNYVVPITYSLSPKPKDPRELLSKPLIQDLYNGKLSGYGANQKFSINIPYYDDATDSDHILFYTKNGLNLPVRKIQDATEPDYSFELYYNDFSLNELSELSYVVARNIDNTLYSNIEYFTYIGGGDNKPADGIDRIFDMPIIYASEADPKSHPPFKHDEQLKLEYGSTIGPSSIEGYRENGGYGLFVQIIGTNDPTDKQKPKFGDKIHFTMYLNGDHSDDYTVNKGYKKINKQYSCTIKDVSDNAGGKTSTTVVSIPHDLIVNFASSPEYGTPNIYFEYYIMDDEGIRTYCNYYYSGIETVGV
ncbi:hypothetical protein [Xenorhabdus hominickii]|uniref:Uncharacterized protein n=1 Tax=Xenorhabdus hominickii TaxID=351679 RepID=A0A2G0QFA5_XENHO|nr:hypothetical protein [Xenorhabdus hominickii]AOM41934.1 hypothetical protein A9255_16040 [Xenorhabdus hominickii]PHM57915.1 hypothetical protein Xhom_00918 [Xenorhabdus hominickii]